MTGVVLAGGVLRLSFDFPLGVTMCRTAIYLRYC